MKRVVIALAFVVAAAAASCARPKASQVRSLPAGDGVWFEDGIGPGGADVEETLLRAGLGTVFLPAVQLSREGGHWVAQEAPPPPHPLSRSKIFLVFSGDESVDEALSRKETAAPLGDAIWIAAKAALRDTRPFGPVVGIHLDFPFAVGSSEAYGSLVAGLRSKMPQEIPLTVSLRFAPSAQDLETIRPLSTACDGLVALVFGEGNLSDPIAADSLERQWWAGYAPAARGVWRETSGQPREDLPEWVLGRLSDDPRAEFVENVSLKEESGQTFEVRPRSPISYDKTFSFGPGDLLSFRQPLVSDLAYRLGSDLTGRRFARGRVILLPGRSDAERLFTLSALSDVLLGKPTKPDLHVATESARNVLSVSAENVSAHASVISRTSNWVEVQLPSGGIRDIQIGGFDRFEVYGADRRPITLSLATVVRFYETLIQPNEKISPARIFLRRPPPKGCCATRFHFLAASGEETLSGAVVVPTPSPLPRGRP